MIFDVPELREQIKKLKLQKADCDVEKKQIEDEILATEERASKLKQELNILEATKFSDSSEGGNFLDIDSDRKFYELNRKLELKILNQEIRSVIPSLESEALELEAQVHSLEKAAAQAEEFRKSLPITFTKSRDEIESEIAGLLEDRLKLKATMARDAEQKKQEKTLLLTELRQMRDIVRVGVEDTHTAMFTAMKSQLNTCREEARIETLAKEQEELRREIAHFYPNGRGWETEAFVLQTGARDAKLPANLVTAALQFWVPPHVDLSQNNIQSCLDELKLGAGKWGGGGDNDEQMLGIDAFFQLCDLLTATLHDR